MLDSNANDKKLFKELKKKDKEAFLLAYDKYFDNIYRFIFFKVGSKEEAEDLTSSVFLKTWDYIQRNQLIDYDTLRSFLYTVARNLVIDHYRKKSNDMQVSLDGEDAPQIVDHKQDLLNDISLKADYKEISKKMFSLKDEYREVLVLKYVNELSVGEIADILNKSRGNTRVLVFRALKALRELTDKKTQERT